MNNLRKLTWLLPVFFGGVLVFCLYKIYTSTFIPKYNIGDCIESRYYTNQESWETNKEFQIKIAKVGKHTYQYYHLYLDGGKVLWTGGLHNTSFYDLNSWKKIECPKEIK